MDEVLLEREGKRGGGIMGWGGDFLFLLLCIVIGRFTEQDFCRLPFIVTVGSE